MAYSGCSDATDSCCTLRGKLSFCLVCRICAVQKTMQQVSLYSTLTSDIWDTFCPTPAQLLCGYRCHSNVVSFFLCLPQICFVNLDPQKTDYRDDKSIKVSRILVPFHPSGTLIFIFHIQSLAQLPWIQNHYPELEGLICLENLQLVGGSIAHGSRLLTGRIL